jgi:hypothetical protein
MANLSNTQYNVELEDIKNEYATQRDSLRTNVTNISAQENALMTDVNTVDEQRIKAEASNVRAQAEAERNRKRYGIQLTGAEQSQLANTSSLTQGSTVSGAMNFARRNDEQTNLANTYAMTSLLRGGYKGALAQLQAFGDIGVARNNEYENARAKARAQYYGFLGNLASIAVGAAVGASMGGGGAAAGGGTPPPR